MLMTRNVLPQMSEQAANPSQGPTSDGAGGAEAAGDDVISTGDRRRKPISNQVVRLKRRPGARMSSICRPAVRRPG